MDLFEFAKLKDEEETEEEVSTDALKAPILTVGEITSELKALIVNKYGREAFWVKGELSGYKGRNQSGHMYFRLKDETAVLNCVFFRGRNRALSIELKEGMEVVAFGRLDLWEKGGNYQLIIEEVRPGGTGELYLKFEQLKKKLLDEGLFAAERKRPIPDFPLKVGVITSTTGAVLRDIIHVVRRRCSLVKLYVAPVKVQGEGAKEEIADALTLLNRPELALEVIIVARGGGSIEDLWAFNEEIVARALAASRLPVISAVGHQTDYTISDFVSDVRAATPSHAAEMVVPDMTAVRRGIEHQVREVLRELHRARDVASHRISALLRSPFLRDPGRQIEVRRQRLDLAVDQMMANLLARRDRANERLGRSFLELKLHLQKLLAPIRLRLEKAASNLDMLSPLSILSRGYSYVTGAGGRIITKYNQVNPDSEVQIRLHEGRLTCQVKTISKN